MRLIAAAGSILVAFQLIQTIGYSDLTAGCRRSWFRKSIEVTKSLVYTFIIAIAAPVGPLIGYCSPTRFERKWQIGWAAIGIAAFGLLFARQTRRRA